MAACKAIASLFRSRSSLFINNSKLGFIKTIIPNESKRQFATLTSAFGSSSTFSENKYIKKIKNDRHIHVSRSCLDASIEDYYSILGIESNSSSKNMKNNYRAFNNDNNEKKENDIDEEDWPFIERCKTYFMENKYQILFEILIISTAIYCYPSIVIWMIFSKRFIFIGSCALIIRWIFS